MAVSRASCWKNHRDRSIKNREWAFRLAVASQVEQYREVVADAASQYKQMPDAVGPRIPVVEDEEHHARGIEDAAGQQPAKARGRQGGDDRVQGEQAQPAHHQVDDDRYHSCPLARQGVEDDADCRQSPDRAEHPPAPGALKRDEGEGGVCPRDEQVDGLVVEHLKDRLGRAAQAVIEGGDEVEQEQGEAVDAEADDLAGISAVRGEGDEYRPAGQRDYRADEVADAVEPFAFVHGRYSTGFDEHKVSEARCVRDFTGPGSIFPLTTFHYDVFSVTWINAAINNVFFKEVAGDESLSICAVGCGLVRSPICGERLFQIS